MQDTETLGISAGQSAVSAEELTKQLRKETRQKFLDRIRGNLESISHQLAFSPAEAAICCGKSASWAYRLIYAGKLRVLNAEEGRLLIPRSEIERFLSGADKYAPQPKAKSTNGVMDVKGVEKVKPQPGPELQILAIQYELLSVLSNLSGSLFWAVEQKRWRVADKIEELEEPVQR